jgi:phosphohistidine phosphatase
MKTLIITRHGKAVEAEKGQHDILRKLSKRGHKYFKIIARELIKKDLVPGLILSSPAIRALGTANQIASYFDESKVSVLTYDPLYSNFSNEMFDFIESVGPKENIVMLVGHNPTLPVMIEHLSGVILESFPTLSTLILDFDVEKWLDLKENSGTMRKLLITKELK